MDDFEGIRCCGTTYKFYEDLGEHVKNVHFSRDQKYQCPQCIKENATGRGIMSGSSMKSFYVHCFKFHQSKMVMTNKFSFLNDISKSKLSNAQNGQHIQNRQPPNSHDDFFPEDDFDAPNESYYSADEEEMEEELYVPHLVNHNLRMQQGFEGLTLEENFCVELLKCKALGSVTFSSMMQITVAVLTFVKTLYQTNQLSVEVFDRLISLAKSKYSLINLALKIGDSTNLFFEKEIPRSLPNQGPIKVSILNLRAALMKFLSKSENVQALVTEKAKPFNPNVISTIRDTGLVEEAEKELNLYLQIYADGFDIKSGLSSSSDNSNICGVYLTFANMPYELQSKRTDQILLGCIKAKELDKNTKFEFFKFITDQIDELNSNPIQLSEGFTSRPVLWSVLADNLESNFLQGLTTSFNSDSCKYCDIHKNSLLDQEVGDPRLVQEHVFKDCSSAIGPVLFAPDIFHDLNEGVVLKYFELFFAINSVSVRSKIEENYKGFQDILKNGLLRGVKDGALIGTGCQKLEFFLIFPFLLTDNVEVAFDKQMYYALRQIIEYCYSDSINRDSIHGFRELIKYFLMIYKETIKNYNRLQSIKPLKFTFKLHHLYHYPEMILRFGPLKLSSTIRGERFHQFHKYAITASKSYVNVPRQICNNWSIFFTLSEFVRKKFDRVKAIFDPNYLSRLSPFIGSLIEADYDPSKTLVHLEQVDLGIMKIELNKFYLFKKTDSNQLPSIIKINLILSQPEGTLWIFGKIFESVRFDRDKFSFILRETDQILRYDVDDPAYYRELICFEYFDNVYAIKHNF